MVPRSCRVERELTMQCNHSPANREGNDGLSGERRHDFPAGADWDDRPSRTWWRPRLDTLTASKEDAVKRLVPPGKKSKE